MDNRNEWYVIVVEVIGQWEQKELPVNDLQTYLTILNDFDDNESFFKHELNK